MRKKLSWFLIKGIYISTALTSVYFSCINKNALFIQETVTFGHIVERTIYTSHIDDFTPQHSTFKQAAACLLIFFRVTSWFETVCNTETCWMNFRKNNSLTNTNYNIILYYLEVFCSNVQISYIWVMQMVFSKVHPACQFYKKQFLFILEKTHASRRLKKIYLLNALAL